MTYFRQRTPDVEITLVNGSRCAPVATLADEYGGRAQVLLDDGCYVLALRVGVDDSDRYHFTSHLFPEAHAVLRALPIPRKRSPRRLVARELPLTVDIHPAEDVPGQWVAHVLELDVVSQGNDPDHAFVMALDAAELVIDADRAEGRDPLDRRPYVDA